MIEEHNLGTDDAQQMIGEVAAGDMVGIRGGRAVRRWLANMLAAKSVRLLDLLNTWDANGDGTLTRLEFRRALEAEQLAGETRNPA